MKYETPKIISETSEEAPTAFIPVFVAIGAVFVTAALATNTIVATNTVLVLAIAGAVGVAAAAGAVYFVASSDSC